MKSWEIEWTFRWAITFAAGYAGIRAKQQDDLALIVSGTPASAAAVFTQNQVQAAPVRLARKHLNSPRLEKPAPFW